jgi:ubiquinone/menaquinone biosynthesis C-methylase UbiE
MALTDRAVGLCTFAAGSHILDVGCGAGATVDYLIRRYGLDARGVDSSPTLIAEGLGRNPALPLTQAPAETLPFAGETQDGVFCECVLSLLGQPLQALAEFQRVLRSGGYLILSDLYTRDETATLCNQGVVSRVQLEAWLSASGFAPLLWEDHTSALKELAARLVLAHGSLEGLCYGTGMSRQWTGYYLLVARKYAY